MTDITYGFKRFYIRDGLFFSTGDPDAPSHRIGVWETCSEPEGFYFSTRLEPQALVFCNSIQDFDQVIYKVAARGNVKPSGCELHNRRAQEIFLIEAVQYEMVQLFGQCDWELLDPQRIAIRESRLWENHFVNATEMVGVGSETAT